MARLVLQGEPFEVRPLTLYDLHRVGPEIDRLNARARGGLGEAGGFAGQLEAALSLLTVIAVGVEGEDGESLMRRADAADLCGLWATYAEVMREAGIRPSGELQPVPAPAEPRTPRSRSGSRTSSPNW